ncbi:putative bifunctional diguanylate cyclase/phosphodiesterase [Colwellia psychrerythraea]|uniref:cyclic-guanylate-specific phosphodiesterase n=1 Tax=Colwellia psychrerythraea TaxID=28229 RepID=A0A099KVR1_COLPS|nr:EAL domain-containing protein [Colwellia psychrerythraea]KGJ93952.1 response regulator receiver modulated diguanylate cyclase/phosphodiesterase [Colwellia psychrerythraea]
MTPKSRNAFRPKILIVDDIAANRFALRQLLKSIDAELIEAESGEEALFKAIEIKNLALILLDVQMPVMDGYEAAELLREEEQTQHIPIIFITAVHRDEQHILKGYSSGAIDYITKPVQPDILAAKISLFMELWRLRFGLEQEIITRSTLEDKNKFLADHDILTNLPNRRRLFLEIERATARADREGKEFALLFVDIDGFKSINDSLGHKIGDCVLIEMADRFTRLVRKTDTVARFGGDEFVILLTDVDDSQHLIGRINQILLSARKLIIIEHEEISLSASIGVCVYPAQLSDPSKLVDFADIAMYKSKQNGKNTFSFFSEEMDAAAHKRLAVEKQLRHAIKNDEFEVHYQPIIDAATERPIGVEALLRWNNPTLGSIPPDYFIPIAESTGHIHEIGAWVFEQSIMAITEITSKLPLNLNVAVNASTLQFKNSTWFKTVQKAIKAKKILPENLEIEITESLLLDDCEEVNQQLSAIHELGIRFSVDDFGTGYSALSYLKRCPINTVKIDRSFVQGIPEDKEDMVLIHAIIAMAHGLNLKVIAEGIETPEQWLFLKQENCDFAQGYYFSKPLPINELKLWLSDNS